MPGKATRVRILGIDPGSLTTGYGVIESDGSHNRYIASGPIKAGADDLAGRLKVIFEQVSLVIEEYQPEVVAIEQVFMNRNADSALKLGQARGAAVTAAAMLRKPVVEYTARLIKQSVAGKGSASKQQVQHMVRVLLNYQGRLQADEADALAVALCHGHIGATMQRMKLKTPDVNGVSS